MSDKLNDKKYDAIDPDSVIEIQISGKFYADMRGLFMYYLSQNNRSKKDMSKIMNNLVEDKITSEEEYPLHTIFQFLVYIEAQAKLQGFIIKTDMPDLTEESPGNLHSESDPSE
jgi:hypothetical protein